MQQHVSADIPSGMVPNNIAAMRRLRKLPARAISEKMDGVTPPIFSTIENGRVMPTKAGLKVMCNELRCRPTDLYSADQLTLAPDDATPSASGSAASPGPVGRDHPGQIEFRTWLRKAERETLRDTIKALGYRNEAEWFREMYRNTVARRRRLEGSTRK